MAATVPVEDVLGLQDFGPDDIGDTLLWDGTDWQKAPVQVFVFHGGDANVPRPDAASVLWKGWVEPSNAQAVVDDWMKLPAP